MTGVADYIPERIAHLVYVDAVVPEDGQSVEDLGWRGIQRSTEDGWAVPAPPVPPAIEFNSNGKRRILWQPIGTLTERIKLSMRMEEHSFPLTFVKAAYPTRDESQGLYAAFWEAGDGAKADRRWSYFDLPCDHVVPLSLPRELTTILLNLVQ